MKFSIKKLTKSLSLSALCAGVFYSCHIATGGFTIHSITYPLEKGVSALPDELQFLHNERFYYLGKGAQAFAFVSSDKKYVIKFIRFDHLLPKPFVRLFKDINHPYIKFRLNRSEREIKELLQSFSFAQNELKNDTEVLYFQKHKLDKPIVIYDKIGCIHKINNAPFIVQKYIPSLGDQIYHLENEDQKALIDQVFSLACKRFSHGIKDKDPNLLTNFGFVDHKLVQFDIGRFYSTKNYQNMDIRENELKDIFKPFLEHFIKKDPSIKQYFDEKLKQL
jgi:hypothetical protein